MDNSKKHSKPSHQYIILSIIMCGFAVLASIYSIFVPIFEASDEVWHYPMVEKIASTWSLPVQPLTPGESSGPWRQEGSQPPLYYAIAAVLTSWIDTSDLEIIRYLNPHVAAGEIRPDRNNTNLVVHNPIMEQFPWQGTVLAVHIVRFFSVSLGTWSIYLTWALVRELYPNKYRYALLAAGIHAFTPMYLFISSSVNNDNLIIPLCTLSLLLMVRQIKYTNPLDNKLTMKAYIILGCVTAFAVLTKASGIGLLPFILALIAWQVWQRIKGKSGKLNLPNIILELPYAFKALLFVTTPILVISGWWFYRNIKLYGEILGLNAFYAVLGMRGVPADMEQLWSERFAFAAGYWGNFGGLNVPMPQWTYDVLNIIAVIAFMGCCTAFAVWLTRKTGSKPGFRIRLTQIVNKLWPFNWDRLTAARALTWAWPVAVFVSWVRWATETWSSQGRLIFSAIPMWSFALFVGINTLFMPIKITVGSFKITMNTVVTNGLVILLMVLCLIALPYWISPAYSLPQNDRQDPPEIYERFLGDYLLLRGYALHEDDVHPGKHVKLTLFWQAIAPTDTNHSIFIHIIGNAERIIAQRDTFPKHGLTSTTWIAPGYTWSETHEIEIPELAYAPDKLSIAIGMYDTHNGMRVPVFDADNVFQGEMALFESMHLTRPDADIPNRINAQFDQAIVLEGYDLSDVIVLRGESVNMTLHWFARRKMDYDYTVSVQFIDNNWNKAGQNDSWPMQGNPPTSKWVKGQSYVETRSVNVISESTPGVYDLRVAIYRIDESGEIVHLPVVWHAGQMPASSITLTRIRVH